MPFGIEWEGKSVTVFVAYSLLEDHLGGHSGNVSDEDCIKTFDRHRGQILDAVAIAIRDPENFDNFGRLYIRQKDIDEAQSGQWHMVTIARGADVAEIEARELMHKFAKVFFESGIPSRFTIAPKKTARTSIISPGWRRRSPRTYWRRSRRPHVRKSLT